MDLTVRGDHCGGMFYAAFCQQAGARVLLGADRFVDLGEGPAGFELRYRCYCGRLGVIHPKSGGAGGCGEAGEAA